MENKGVIELLLEANRNNISLYLEKDQLKYSLKEDTLPDEAIIQELRKRKDEIKLFLQKNKKSSSVNSAAIPLINRELIGHIPLSFAQERLWFIDKLEGSTHYHIPILLNLDPLVRPDGVEMSINALLKRHEILRTIYPEDENGPYQSIRSFTTQQLQQSFVKNELPQNEITEFLKKPFDIAKEGVFRAWLINREKGDRLLVIVVHHIAFDGWSMPIFINELKQCYGLWAQGSALDLPPLEIQYADYSAYQKRHLQGEKLEEMLRYWDGSLKGVSPVELPTDYARPILQSTKGDMVSRELPISTWHQVRKFAVTNEVTPFVTLLAVFKLLISRYTGKLDICVGSPVANRPRRELEPLIGFFVNTLAIRSQIDSSKTFVDFVRQVYKTTLGAFDHQDVPFERIVDRLGLERDMSRPPLVQVIFVLNESGKQPQPKDAGLVKAVPQGTKSSKFDVALSVTVADGRIKVGANYCSDLFEKDTMEGFIVHYEQLLSNLLDDSARELEKVPLLNVVQQKEVMFLSKGADTAANERPLLKHFSNCVKYFSDKNALCWEGQSISYKELDQWSNHLAQQLQQKGISNEDRVGVYLSRTPELIVSILAILKTGGTYVPLNPLLPDERVRFMLETVGARLLLVAPEEQHLDFEIEILSVEPGSLATFDAVSRRADQLTYVVFTSGSTGKPKGVQITDSSVDNLIHWAIDQFQITDKSATIVAAGISFDASVLEIFPHLFSGSELHLLNDELLLSVPQLVDYLKSNQITHSFLPTALVNEFVQATTGQSIPLKYVLTGGDALGPIDVSELDYKLYNNYGPTENTVVSTTYQLTEIDSDQAPAIGKPITGTSAYVLDQFMNLVPKGVEGDLYLGGRQLSIGYLDREELTRRVFIPNPFTPGEWLYKSGDRARWGRNGQLFFLGRNDDQVSVRGYRIELGEVQSVLNKLAGVEECLVIVGKSQSLEGQLVAYVRGNKEQGDAALFEGLKERLPGYMIPTVIVFLDQFELTPNGKIDKERLPEALQSANKKNTPPNTPTEKTLASIWCDLLKLQKDQIDLSSDFFRIGGHSLLATRLSTRIDAEFGIKVSVRNIFSHSTLGELASVIERQKPKEGQEIKTTERPPQIPLSFAQERLWFIDRLEGGTQYHIALQVPLAGSIDSKALKKAYSAMINRHEILRTVYQQADGVPQQLILQEKKQWLLPRIQVEEEAYRTHLLKFNQRLFDLAQDIPLRAELVQVGKSYRFIMVIHHIAFDGWSQDVFEKELIALYQTFEKGLQPTLPPIAIQYADYTLWQKKHFTASWFEKELGFWENRLQGIEPLELVTDFPRPVVASYEGKTFSRQLSKESTQALIQMANQNGATLFMVVQVAVSILLARHGRTRDIVLGTPVANRDQKEIEDLIGFFVNTLVLRNDLSAELSVDALMTQVKRATLEAYEHQQVPFEKIVERVETTRDMSRNPIFQVMLLLHMNEGEQAPKEILEHRQTTAKFDLTISFTETKNQNLSIGLNYASTLFEEASMELMMVHLLTLLEGMVKNTQTAWTKLLLQPGEKESSGWVQEAREQYALDTVINEFQKSAVEFSSQKAILYEGRSVTYEDLERASNQLSHFLHSKGVDVGDMVAIDMERSIELVILIFGILKSGAAYVPLDRKQPRLRRNYILEQTASKFLITDDQSEAYGSGPFAVLKYDRIQFDAYEDSKPVEYPLPGHLAYVIFTSGSTGNPKGVQITHESLNTLVKGMEQLYPSTCDDTMMFKTNYIFDVSCHELFCWFTSGGKLSILPPDKEADPDAIIQTIDHHAVTRINFVPSLLRLFLEYAAADKATWQSLKYIFSAGEALSPALVDYYRKMGASARLENLYGPTESTIYATAYSSSNYQGTLHMPIGKPLPHVGTCVIDDHGDRLPAGIPGELCLGGEALSVGYLKDSNKTDQAFFQDANGKRWYRSGDLVRCLSDGNIEYLGRIDDQVKLRGYRIELGEIDAILNKISGINLAVTRIEGEGELSNLVSFYEGVEVPEEEIRQFLGSFLPAYMIPDQFVFVPALPILPSGKIDKQQLIAPKIEFCQEEIEEPTNPIAIQLREIWSDLLQIEVTQIGIESDFFVLGGHSLLVIRLISKVKASWQIDLKVRDVFQFPTLQLLVGHLESSQVDVGLGIVAQKRPDKIPLSFAQERIWFIDKLEGSQQYHIPLTIPLRKEIRVEGIAFAISELRNRHEVLRTVYLEEQGVPYQQVLNPREWNLETSQTTGEEVNNLIGQEIRKPFDLTADSMARAELFEIADEGYLLMLVIHHIAFDGWSQPILLEELTTLYRLWEQESDTPLDPLLLQYADYSIWQRQLISGNTLEQELTFWEKALAGVEPLQLPTDFHRPQVQSGKGGFVSIRLTEETTEALKALSRDNQATLYMTLMSAYHVFLHRYTRQVDLCVGTPMANRSNEEVEGLIGLFVNTLVIRSTLESSMSFEKLLLQLKTFILDAHQHQEVPFEKVVERVEKNRDLSRHPLIQTMFNLQQGSKIADSEDRKEATFESKTQRENALFDLSLIAVDQAQGLSLTLEYAADLFEEATAETMLEQFQELLIAIIASPTRKIGALRILPKVQLAQLLARKIDLPVIEKKDLFLQGFQYQVRTQPNSIACIEGEESISYQLIDEQSDQLAAQLVLNSVDKGDRVVVLMDRSMNLIRSVLAIMKLGAVYVPVDHDYPLERKHYILEDTKAPLILTDQTQPDLETAQIVLDDLWEDQIERVQYQGAEVTDLAYLIYTSGTTGRPKGVMINQESLTIRLREEQSLLNLKPEDRTITSTNHVFDVSILEIFLPLYSGASICILNGKGTKDLRVMAKQVCLDEVTLLQCTPSMLDALIDVKEQAQVWEKVRLICLGGESLSNKLLKKIKAKVPDAQINNHYGPTETTVDALVYPGVSSFDKNLIGKPLPSLHAYVLNDHFAINPIGVPGELCLSGGGIADGYWNKPDITSKSFVKDPFHPEHTLYRTGDLVRQLKDSNIEFLGRIDHQVKIRGFRVELEEIEKALVSLSVVDQCAVDVLDSQSGEKELVTWVKCRGHLDESKLRAQLTKKLPTYMVPAYFIEVGEMPLTVNGKIDRKALPKPEQRSTTIYVGPSGELEKQLVEIWSDLLHLAVDQIGVEDNFFEIGGHSLLAVRLMARIADMLYIELPISSLFEYATVRSLGARIEQLSANDENMVKDRLLTVHKGQGNNALFFVHGAGGNPMIFYPLGSHCDQSSLFAFEAQGLDGFESPLLTVESLADQYVEALLQKAGKGPITLGGYSFGGKIAFEMVLKLQSLGHKVNRLILFDALIPDHEPKLDSNDQDRLLCRIAELFAHMNGKDTPIDVTSIRNLEVEEKFKVIHELVVKRGVEVSLSQLRGFINVYKANLECSYTPVIKEKPSFDVLHFIANQADESLKDSVYFDWTSYTTGSVTEHRMEADHFNILHEPIVSKIAVELDQFLC